MDKNDLKSLRNTLVSLNTKEKNLIALAPKLEPVCIEEVIKRRETDIQYNSFLDPIDEKQYRKSNAMPPLGFSSSHRIGKG